MTHLSDYSFLQRLVSLTFVLIWNIYRLWKLDRFDCLSLSTLRQGKIKSIVTILLLVMIPFQLYYDIVSCKIKYEEGYIDIFGRIISKPESMWTPHNQSLVPSTDYSLCIGLSLQNGILLLLQCFWSDFTRAATKQNFMGSKEFKLYACWSIATMVGLPILRFIFSNEAYDPTYKEIIPELVYGISKTPVNSNQPLPANIIVAAMGVRSNKRFQQLLNKIRHLPNEESIRQRIYYFQDLNILLSCTVFGAGASMTVLSVDSLTGRKILNTHKLPADLFICNTNICTIVSCILLILIVLPDPALTGGHIVTQIEIDDLISASEKPVFIELSMEPENNRKPNESFSRTSETLSKTSEDLSKKSDARFSTKSRMISIERSAITLMPSPNQQTFGGAIITKPENDKEDLEAASKK